MRYLFGSAGTRELTALLTSTPLFAFDFDGTLAPLSEQPARSALRATTRRLLTRIAKYSRIDDFVRDALRRTESSGYCRARCGL